MTSIEGKSGLIDAGTLVINNNVEILKPVDIINEFEDTEVEQKFQVLGNQQPEFLNSIVNTLLETKNFALVEGLEKFKWIFHFDYYGYDDDGKTYQIFHSIHHESTPKFWIRKKLSITQPSEGKSVLPLVRKEKKEEINRSYSGEYIDSVVEQYKKLLGKDVYLLGRLTRRKYYSFLRNERSLRTYNIGVDFCEFMDKKPLRVIVIFRTC